MRPPSRERAGWPISGQWREAGGRAPPGAARCGRLARGFRGDAEGAKPPPGQRRRVPPVSPALNPLRLVTAGSGRAGEPCETRACYDRRRSEPRKPPAPVAAPAQNGALRAARMARAGAAGPPLLAGFSCLAGPSGSASDSSLGVPAPVEAGVAARSVS